jgi:hypothetical protein
VKFATATPESTTSQVGDLNQIPLFNGISGEVWTVGWTAGVISQFWALKSAMIV